MGFPLRGGNSNPPARSRRNPTALHLAKICSYYCRFGSRLDVFVCHIRSNPLTRFYCLVFRGIRGVAERWSRTFFLDMVSRRGLARGQLVNIAHTSLYYELSWPSLSEMTFLEDDCHFDCDCGFDFAQLQHHDPFRDHFPLVYLFLFELVVQDCRYVVRVQVLFLAASSLSPFYASASTPSLSLSHH